MKIGAYQFAVTSDINKNTDSHVDDQNVRESLDRIRKVAEQTNIYVIVGSITKNREDHHNSAVFFSPDNEISMYHKRALFGWDSDNFVPSDKDGVFEIDELEVGVRICFEVRFPEYFRELYRAHTDLNVILFYDVTD